MERAQAEHYAAGRASTLFEMDMGLVDKGCDLSWLSQVYIHIYGSPRYIYIYGADLSWLSQVHPLATSLSYTPLSHPLSYTP